MLYTYQSLKWLRLPICSSGENSKDYFQLEILFQTGFYQLTLLGSTNNESKENMRFLAISMKNKIRNYKTKEPSFKSEYLNSDSKMQ